MKKVLINKKGNYILLRILYPKLIIADNNIQEYGNTIFSTFEYESPDSDLFLLQSTSGICMDNLLGLCNFLREVKFMAVSKIDRLQKHEGFNKNDFVASMYEEAVSLKISNRFLYSEEAGIGFCMDMLARPLYDRMCWAAKAGYQNTIKKVFYLLDNFTSKESSFKPLQFQKMGLLMSKFNRLNFKSTYRLSGNAELDCYLLLSYFG